MNSFEKLYSENYHKVYRVALKMSGSDDRAMDIIQEVFMSLFDKMQSGEEILYPGTWLYRVAVNKCCDNHRMQKRFEPIETAFSSESPDEPLESLETRELMEKVLMELRPRERVVIVLYSEGLSYKEISEASGIRFRSVGKTIARILEKLEKRLKKLKHEVY